jgi:hypothetical protein
VLAIRNDENGLLANPVDYSQIWNDRGSGAKHDVAVWRPIPPKNYSCLGDVATEGYQKPSLKEIVCVTKDLIENGRVGSLIWNDRGSGARQDVSIWGVEPTSNNGINANLFRAERSYKPLNQALPVLKRMID